MNAPQTVRQRNHVKRFVSWIVLYVLIFVAFLALIYHQSSKVDTLEFPSGQLQITTSAAKYTAGNTIHYTLKNNLVSPITIVSHCPQEPLHVYQWENNQWVRIHDTANTTICSKYPKQLTVPPNGSIHASYADWPNLFKKPGIYRIVAFADNYPELPYADFQVVPKPTPAVAPKTVYIPVYTPVYKQIYLPAPTQAAPRDGGGD